MPRGESGGAIPNPSRARRFVRSSHEEVYVRVIRRARIDACERIRIMRASQSGELVLELTRMRARGMRMLRTRTRMRVTYVRGSLHNINPTCPRPVNAP